MVYLNYILFCWIFSHFILKTQSDLLKGILLGSALKDSDDSEETEVLVIRIPKQRSFKKGKSIRKMRLTTTTTESPSTTNLSTTTAKNTAYQLDTIQTLSVKAFNSTPISLMKRTEYSTQTSVTTENICGANQTFTHCLNECGNRCNDRANNKLCPVQYHCFGFGCTCDPNFVRDEMTDRCVKLIDCPRPIKCSSGERFFVCGGCGPTCAQPVPVCPRICRVEGGCDCIRGLVRNIHGKCVPLGLCTLSDKSIDLKTKSKVFPKSN